MDQPQSRNSSDASPAGSASAAARLQGLLAECVRREASDLHLSAGLSPHLRIHGALEPQGDLPPCSAEELEALATSLLGRRNRRPLEENGSVDGSLSGADGARFRYNIFRTGGGLAIALRRLEDRFRSLRELGLPESLYDLCDLPDGLVLVAGPTGAGKSTTLASLVDRINRTRQCHIVTIEDPVEYLHRPQRSLIHQREIGTDAGSFNEALVASLRQDPDVILVGEIRDLNTIRTAITAAETGHLVLTTVHAGDCVGAIERLVSVFPADEQTGLRKQLSMVLKAVVAQHLLIADGATSSATDGARRSRRAACEVLLATPAVANLIASGKSAQIYSVMESGAAQGMQTLEQCLANLWVEGWISEATATGLARNPRLVQERAGLLRRSGGSHGPKGGTL